MANITVFDMKGKNLEEKSVSQDFLDKDVKHEAIKNAVIGYLAHQRQGNACTKTRGEVNGSGKKPWKQKGTGRARVGSRSSAIWRGGHTVFGPRPRDYSYAVTKKTKQLARESALRMRLLDGQVVLLRDLKLDAPKTQNMVQVLNKLKLDNQSVLLVTQTNNRNAYLSCRNIQKVSILPLAELNAYEILKHKKLIFEEAAFDALNLSGDKN